MTGVMQNSQAAQAGILSGDILTRLGGSEINNVKDVIKVMNAHNVGDVSIWNSFARANELLVRRRSKKRHQRSPRKACAKREKCSCSLMTTISVAAATGGVTGLRH